MDTQFQPGDIVTIGQRFEMGDRIGHGRMVNDEHTDRLCTVVSVKGYDVTIAFGEFSKPIHDEGDLIIVARRLKLVRRPLYSEWTVL